MPFQLFLVDLVFLLEEDVPPQATVGHQFYFPGLEGLVSIVKHFYRVEPFIDNCL